LLAAIRRHIPQLTWAIYPRSITTPTPIIAGRVQDLIASRRRTGVPDLDDEAISAANMDELRTIALLKARPRVVAKRATTLYRARSKAIRLYVLQRANGHCEACGAAAPFVTAGGSPYLEPHHITRLADEGPDHPARVIGLCPNCHRRAQYADDAKAFKRVLRNRASRAEREINRTAV
jgi:5-methylcytosine-specific restriction protein A